MRNEVNVGRLSTEISINPPKDEAVSTKPSSKILNLREDRTKLKSAGKSSELLQMKNAVKPIRSKKKN